MKKFIYTFAICCIFLCISDKAFCQIYSDLDSSHWAYKKIQALSEEGVLFGYPDGTFKPESKVTRAEFASMVINGLHQQDASIAEVINFKDLPQNHWAYNTVERAVGFDLIKGTPEGYFYPQEPVTRAHAISVAVNALDTRSISEKKARDVLKSAYADYELIPDWIVINAGKAEILDMNVKVPYAESIFNADKPASRAEAAVAVYNMVEQAKLNPNKKLAEAMRPKTADGIIVHSAVMKGSYITIPEGTNLPVIMINEVSSQKSNGGELFMVRIPQNYVTKEKYLILSENSPIAGQILEVKKGKYFVRNAKLTMQTKTIRTVDRNQEAAFDGIVNTKIKRKFWAKLGRAIFKGSKINIKNGQNLEVELLKPIKVDTTNGKIAQ